MNIWDILILLLIAGAVFLAVRTLRRGKKKGCSGCCSGCSLHCAARKGELK